MIKAFKFYRNPGGALRLVKNAARVSVNQCFLPNFVAAHKHWGGRVMGALGNHKQVVGCECPTAINFGSIL